MPLTIVIPCGPPGLERLKSSVDAIEFLGGLQKHTVLFCAAPSVVQQVAEQASRLRAICPNVTVDTLPREPEGAGRFGPFNMIFRDSVEILFKRGNKNPWMWWEEDVTPIRAGWADRLELEYHQKGMPFMGVRRRASEVVRGMKGERLPDTHPNIQGEYMVAVGIYPPNFKDYSTMYKYPDPAGNMPTDVVIRHEVSKYLHHTLLIEHRHSTTNFRRNAQGKIECDDLNPIEPGGVSYAGVVNDMAFVVHGDKKGSLSQLILSEMPGNVSEMPAQTQATSSNAEIERLKAENAELRKDIVTMQQQWSAKENGYAEEIETLKEKLQAGGGRPVNPPSNTQPATASGQTIAEKPLPSLDEVAKSLKEAGKSVQLANLAADFGCNKLALKNALSQDPRFRIAPGGLSWISLAA